jgi:uncharacterized lipoprotein YmbA
MNVPQKRLNRMSTLTLSIGVLVLLCVALSGCRIFKPVQDFTRYYVLSATATTPAPTAVHANQNLNIGIAPVEIPAYLESGRIAVRQGTNEIRYSENRQWAEHIDKGIQRVLALDLSTLLPGSRLITSAWQRADVQAEVHISIQRFELDENGEVALDCQWRIISPSDGHTNRSGHAFINKKGPPLANNPTAAVNTLSEAVADVSKNIATAF